MCKRAVLTGRRRDAYYLLDSLALPQICCAGISRHNHTPINASSTAILRKG
jgi:hypothetical protein